MVKDKINLIKPIFFSPNAVVIAFLLQIILLIYKRYGYNLIIKIIIIPLLLGACLCNKLSILRCLCRG